MSVLISLRGAILYSADGSSIQQRLDWTICDGETWAIVGRTGSGKTTLARLIQGNVRLESGSIEWPLIDRLRQAGREVAWPSQVIDHLAFREESRLFSCARHYYQERFNFSDPLDNPTLEQFLCDGTDVDKEAIRSTSRALGIEALRPLPL